MTRVIADVPLPARSPQFTPWGINKSPLQKKRQGWGHPGVIRPPIPTHNHPQCFNQL